ncbi:cephalosporin-C deacetylase [Actinacidiphila yanglinensis]|uniref:Cephalosporin-C deacetylase n=1 Tax=Actinacidiphila yanglinensis TaxID=310779 RepID=A0A1H6EE75_9ACTN|nr:acetylxylan esterase [Actinacidiphila yanglinensis]SEG95174.1 cephalosporin-C deacetylase [Actinacidiphila yanglinensis]
MALFDLSLSELHEYHHTPEPPADFEEFWTRTLAEADTFPLAPRFVRHDAALPNVAVYDVRFAGWGGDEVHAWLLVPGAAPGPVPCVVQYLGYGSGRGYPHDHTLWAAAGWAVLVMDTRGVSGVSGLPGSTPDPHTGSGPQVPGFVTRGIQDPEQYYYRRVFTDAVRAVRVAAVAPGVDPHRVVVAGGSQGGAIAQAVAALHTVVAPAPDAPAPIAALIDVPFLTHIRRAVDVTDADPYQELVRYLATRRHDVERVFATLAYFDGLHMAAFGRVPALYSVALRDPVCPPSTVFAAYHAWPAPKEITVWPYNQHEGGGSEQRGVQLRWLRKLLGGASADTPGISVLSQ